jgi:hypothetical protein
MRSILPLIFESNHLWALSARFVGNCRIQLPIRTPSESCITAPSNSQQISTHCQTFERWRAEISRQFFFIIFPVRNHTCPSHPTSISSAHSHSWSDIAGLLTFFSDSLRPTCVRLGDSPRRRISQTCWSGKGVHMSGPNSSGAFVAHPENARTDRDHVPCCGGRTMTKTDWADEVSPDRPPPRRADMAIRSRPSRSPSFSWLPTPSSSERTRTNRGCELLTELDKFIDRMKMANCVKVRPKLNECAWIGPFGVELNHHDGTRTFEIELEDLNDSNRAISISLIRDSRRAEGARGRLLIIVHRQIAGEVSWSEREGVNRERNRNASEKNQSRGWKDIVGRQEYILADSDIWGRNLDSTTNMLSDVAIIIKLSANRNGNPKRIKLHESFPVWLLMRKQFAHQIILRNYLILWASFTTGISCINIDTIENSAYFSDLRRVFLLFDILILWHFLRVDRLVFWLTFHWSVSEPIQMFQIIKQISGLPKSFLCQFHQKVWYLRNQVLPVSETYFLEFLA